MTGAGDANETEAGGDAERGPADGQTTTDPGPTSGESDTGPPGGETGRDPADIDDAFERVTLDEPQGLDPAVRYYWFVGSLLGAIPLTLVVGGLAFVLNETIASVPVASVAAATFVLLVVLGGVRSVLRYRSWEYVVREESLFLRRGVLTRVQTVVPYVRVQHIDTRRGALERVFGLSSLVVYTAGSRGADVTVPGLTPDRASALQARLKRLAIESEEEEAV